MVNYEKLIDSLIILGLNKVESTLYLYLHEAKEVDISKISSDLEFSLDEIKLALKSLQGKNIISCDSTKPNIYNASNINYTIEVLETEYSKEEELLKEELKNSECQNKPVYFYNIEGYKNIIKKTNGIIKESKNEICISGDFDLAPFVQELEMAIKRGVKVIFYTFNKQNIYNLKLKTYFRKAEPHKPNDTRLMLTSDNKISLMADKDDGYNLVGSISNDPIYLQTITEHIHHDIYLSKIFNTFENALEKIDPINSKHEKVSKQKMERHEKERKLNLKKN